jgi:hypothetical protein
MLLIAVLHHYAPSQHLLERLLLCWAQAARELDVHPDEEVASFTRFPRQRHSESRIPLFMAGLRGPGLAHPDGLSIDRPHDSLPASERLLEIELDCCDKVVALTLESRMFFLQRS